MSSATDAQQVERAKAELSASVKTLLAAHKSARAAEPHAARGIEGALAGLVRELMGYDGTRHLTAATVREEGGAELLGVVPDAAAHAGAGAGAGAGARPTTGGHGGSLGARVPVWERGLAWEKRRVERLNEWRRQKEAEEKAALEKVQPKPKPASKWSHVQSVIHRERTAAERGLKEAEEEATRLREAAAAEQLHQLLRAQVELALVDKARAEDDAIDSASRAAAESEARAKASAEAAAREAAESAAREAARREAAIRTAFGGKGLERRASMPNKLAWRVSSPDLLSGNLLHEHRVKDQLTRTKGVSFVMGQTRDTLEDVVQAVLFDKAEFDELKAAQWWNENSHRFDAQRRKLEAAAKAAEYVPRPTMAGRRASSNLGGTV